MIEIIIYLFFEVFLPCKYREGSKIKKEFVNHSDFLANCYAFLIMRFQSIFEVLSIIVVIAMLLPPDRFSKNNFVFQNLVQFCSV